MQKNWRLLFLAVAFTVFATRIFLPIINARAYVVGSSGNAGATDYSFNSSLQNLFSPFQQFFNNLKGSNNTTIDIHPVAGSWAQPISLLPIIQQWFSQFDDWFYHLTNVRLSGFLVMILSVFAWVLGLAKGATDWLLGLLGSH